MLSQTTHTTPKPSVLAVVGLIFCGTIGGILLMFHVQNRSFLDAVTNSEHTVFTPTHTHTEAGLSLESIETKNNRHSEHSFPSVTETNKEQAPSPAASLDSLELLRNSLEWPDAEWRESVSRLHTTALSHVGRAWDPTFKTLSNTPLPHFLRTVYLDCLALRLQQFTQGLDTEKHRKWDFLACGDVLEFMGNITGHNTTHSPKYRSDDLLSIEYRACHSIQRKYKVINGVSMGFAGFIQREQWTSYLCNQRIVGYFPSVTQELLEQFALLLSLVSTHFSDLLRLSQEQGLVRQNDASAFEFINLPPYPAASLDELLQPRSKAARADSTPLVGALAHMRTQAIVFSGLISDSEDRLPYLRLYVEYLGLLFRDYRTVFFENDSSSPVEVFLRMWKQENQRVHVISKKFGREKAIDFADSIISEGSDQGKRTRLVWLAGYRNHYLSVLRKQAFSEFDHTLVMDTDLPNSPFLSIVNSFAWNDWDLMCSNGRFSSNNKLRDAFAYRDDRFPTSPITDGFAYNDIKWAPLFDYGSDHGGARLTPQSCFGGMALYRLSTIRAHSDCVYEGSDCEHVSLNRCLHSHGAKLFFNPGMIHTVWE